MSYRSAISEDVGVLCQPRHWPPVMEKRFNLHPNRNDSGDAYTDRKDYDLAIATYSQGIRLDPEELLASAKALLAGLSFLHSFTFFAACAAEHPVRRRSLR